MQIPASFIALVLCASLLFVQGCEQTIDVELPYERLIVINTFVGRPHDSLAWISKTLPATSNPTSKDAAIMNADVKMYWRDTVYQLVPQPSQLGFALPKPDARWYGDSLRMVVEWDGIRAESKARMPQPPSIVSAVFVPSSEFESYTQIQLTIRTRPGVVIWMENLNRSRMPDYRSAYPPLSLYEPYRVINGDPNGPEETITFTEHVHYFDIQPGDSVDILVSAADASYALFLDDPRGDSDGPFSFGGARTYTNVSGTGIGMFVPASTVIATVVSD